MIESTPENRLVAAKTNLIFVKKEREIAICMTTNRVICWIKTCYYLNKYIYSGGSCHENTDSYGKFFFLQKVVHDTLKMVPNESSWKDLSENVLESSNFKWETELGGEAEGGQEVLQEVKF